MNWKMNIFFAFIQILTLLVIGLNIQGKKRDSSWLEDL